MRSIRLAIAGIILFSAIRAGHGDNPLTRAGKATADIVIAKNTPRAVPLAAKELQEYIRKISGATLPIVNTPGAHVATHVYVGKSAYTERLGISDSGLEYGAFRMKTGDNWLALLGGDSDFQPREPWGRNHPNWKNAKLAEWDQRTGGKQWMAPGEYGPGMYRNYAGSAFDYDSGKTNQAHLGIWTFDERGTLNAVYELLREFGVRWYMPGEFGEIVPTEQNLSISEMDKVVRPDFPMRRVNFRYHIPREHILWSLRMGLRDPYDIWVAHGMAPMSGRQEMKVAHPEYYALYAGQRATNVNHLCLSSDELVQENARFARAIFDIYDLNVVSVMPNDGLGQVCQCPLCDGKADLERGYRGGMSDYVWGYVDGVAREVAKTHPDRKILCAAYGTYTGTPNNIKKLSPNVVVAIVGGVSPFSTTPEERTRLRQLRSEWMEKTDNDLIMFENYPHTHRGYYLPSFVPHTIAEGMKELKAEGQTLGGDVWLSIFPDAGVMHRGFSHLNLYITSRFWWNADQDIDAVLEEYYRKFYGPAEKPMKALIEYFEANWRDMQFDGEKIDRAFTLFDEAAASVKADSVYGRRIALLGEYLTGLQKRRKELGKGRENVPELRVHKSTEAISIDGKLDDPFWTTCPDYARGNLKTLMTGEEPEFKSTFKVAWKNSDLYVAVSCQDNGRDRTKATVEKDDDMAIWLDDCVEILLETDAHSYYQITVNSAGAVVDLDRKADKNGWFQWDSQAEAATYVGEDYWSLEIRIPVTESGNDPLHLVVGHEPSPEKPWYFNICRQRVTKGEPELSAFSPTGAGHFHDLLKFGKLEVR